MDEIEAGGVPVVMLRGDGQMNPDGVRDYDLLVPATVEALVDRAARRGARRATSARPRPGARRSSREHGGHPAAQPPVRALLQRTTGARVRVDGEVVGEIGPGLVVLLGVGPDDDEAIADDLARKAAELRIFRDEDGRTNRSLLDVGGAALVVSQFTLYADTRRGRRPGFTGARRPGAGRAALPAVRRRAPGARRRGRDRAGSAPRWRSSSSTTARSRSGSTPTTLADRRILGRMAQLPSRTRSPPRRRTLGDEGRPVPDRTAVRDVGHRRHDPDQRVRPAAGARAVPVARRRPRGDRGRARREGRSTSPLADRIERARADRAGSEAGRRSTVATKAAKPPKPAAADSAEPRATPEPDAAARPDAGSATCMPADRRKAPDADRQARCPRSVDEPEAIAQAELADGQPGTRAGWPSSDAAGGPISRRRPPPARGRVPSIEAILAGERLRSSAPTGGWSTAASRPIDDDSKPRRLTLGIAAIAARTRRTGRRRRPVGANGVDRAVARRRRLLGRLELRAAAAGADERLRRRALRRR